MGSIERRGDHARDGGAGEEAGVAIPDIRWLGRLVARVSQHEANGNAFSAAEEPKLTTEGSGGRGLLRAAAKTDCALAMTTLARFAAAGLVGAWRRSGGLGSYLAAARFVAVSEM